MKFLQSILLLTTLFVGVGSPNIANAQDPKPKTEEAAKDTPKADAAKTATPAKAAAPAPSNAPAKAAEPAKTTDAAKTTGAANPADAAKTTGAANPADAAKTTGTANPADAAKTTGTANPADAGNPAGAANPADAAKATPPAPAKEIEPQKVTKAPAKAADAHGGDAHSFTIENMWLQSSNEVRAVLLLLLFMLVVCIGIGAERYFMLNTSKSQSLLLADSIGKAMNAGSIEDANKIAGEEQYAKAHLARLLQSGLGEFEKQPNEIGIAAVERVLEKNFIGEGENLRKGLNMLATTGATAPFVGLVGTIFGIINAFRQIGTAGGGDLMTLAPAIGEALITTAFGIMVALVGVWLFNYFTAVIDNISNDMTMNSQDFIHWCYKRVHSTNVLDK